jgi:hypothetical protein
MAITPTTPYDQFDATVGDSFWLCEALCMVSSYYVLPLLIENKSLLGQTHQSNSSVGVNDMFYVADGKLAGNAQATQFANQQVNLSVLSNF